MCSLTGKIALVTGSSRGIGKGCALTLAHYGADVVINYERSSKKAEAVSREIEKMGRTSLTVQADVSKESEVKSLFENIHDELGDVDILVNNAGIHQHLKTWELSVDDWQHHQYFLLRSLHRDRS